MRIILATVLALAAAGTAHADTFLPPTITVATSPSGTAMATVIPTSLSCAVGEAGCEPAARAVIELVRGPDRASSTTIRLLNPEAPGATLVTDDGERLLTVNDYAGAGHGPNVLVVYRRNGSVVRRLSLGDFLPEDYIDGLPRTVSTLRWWADEPRIEPDSHRAIIALNLVGPEGQDVGGRRSLPLTLDLDTGTIEAPRGPLWETARHCARANAWTIASRVAERQREGFRRLCR